MKNILITRDNLLKTDKKKWNLVLGVLLFTFYHLLLRSLNTVYVTLDNMYVDYVYIYRIVSYTGFKEYK